MYGEEGLAFVCLLTTGGDGGALVGCLEGCDVVDLDGGNFDGGGLDGGDLEGTGFLAGVACVRVIEEGELAPGP